MGTKTMSNMSQYTGVRCWSTNKSEGPDTYTVILKVGHQSFTVDPPLPLDEAEWMQEQLTVALERIVKERRGDQTW